METIELEIKQWISIYGKAMQVKYKREMDFIVAQVKIWDSVTLDILFDIHKRRFIPTVYLWKLWIKSYPIYFNNLMILLILLSILD